MSAIIRPPRTAPLPPVSENTLEGGYLVSHGKAGAFGLFLADPPHVYSRQEYVVIETRRGTDLGTVLCAANANTGRVLRGTRSGRILRAATAEDKARQLLLEQRARLLFEEARHSARNLDTVLEVLDVQILLDGRHAIFQVLTDGMEPTGWIEELESRHSLQVLLENLAHPMESAQESPGCGKPDCGMGGCATCGDGGCSSCGREAVDMRDYFAHLRTKMEAENRVPLL
jgi:hypothetical protein